MRFPDPARRTIRYVLQRWLVLVAQMLLFLAKLMEQNGLPP